MRRQKRVVIVLACLLFVSCTRPLNEIQPQPSLAIPVTISPTPITLTQFPDFFTIFDGTKNQITDGKLVLSVRELEARCHEFESYTTWNTNVEFVFLNVAAEDLGIPTRFMVTRSGMMLSDINPFWYQQDGSRVELFYWDDIPEIPYWSSVIIPIGGQYKAIINIPLPDHLSGTFMVKFLFHSALVGESKNRFPFAWEGVISSNPIEVCLVH